MASSANKMPPQHLLLQEPQPELSTEGFSSSEALKSSTSQTERTMIESSEEFTLSGEMTTTQSSSAEEAAAPTLRLSNMAIVEENGRRKVHFAEGEKLVTYIVEDKDITTSTNNMVSLSKKKSKKNLSSDTSTQPEEVPPGDIWWSYQELEKIELTAMYMIKEAQQYQEEVICTVLYNKAYLSAANLGKSISEDELEEKMQDVTQYSNTLEQWTAVGHSRRGLENMVSDKGIVNAIQSRLAVLELQKVLKEAMIDNRSDSGATTTTTGTMAQHADFLAKRCQDATRAARIMARMMGQADADSLAKAESLATPALPEPPGRYAGDHEHPNHTSGERISRQNRKGVLSSMKKAVGNVFRRQSSREVNMKRIRKMQQRRQAELEPPKRPSEEFRRSFLDSLDYGEQ